jgi:hypothetical protein
LKTTARRPLTVKIVVILIAVLFLLFAAFQYNDPDSFSWIFLYSYVAIMAIMAAFGRYNYGLLVPGIAIFGLYFIYLLPSVYEWATSDASLITGMSPDRMYVERSREAFGLLMGLAGLVYIFVNRHHLA